MKIRVLLLILCLNLVLCACAKPAEPTPSADLPTPRSAVTINQPELQTSVPEATEEPADTSQPTTHYAFDVQFDYAQHTLNVSQQIDYLNRSLFPLNEILLLVPARAFLGTYTQTLLESPQIAAFTEDGIRTRVQLHQTLLPNQRLTLRLVYSLRLPQREGTFGYTDRQTNLTNWYPFIPPLDADGNWIAHEPLIDANNMVVGEYIVNEIADFSLLLQPTDPTLSLQIATGASARPAENGVRYELDQARSLCLSISREFYLEEKQVGETLIQAYVFPSQKAKAGAILDIAAQSLSLFSELFGEYPREKLVIAAADFLHNMEMDGMLLISHKIIDFYNDTPLNNLTILLPHEISHQWFYSQVGNDQAMEPWLDESIATYSEALFFERYYPEHLQWWWDNRVKAHEHSGYVNNSIYQAGSYEAYRSSVYLNGAFFMQALADAMGKQALLDGLARYVETNRWQIASRQSFFDALQSVNPVDFEAIINRFFR